MYKYWKNTQEKGKFFAQNSILSSRRFRCSRRPRSDFSFYFSFGEFDLLLLSWRSLTTTTTGNAERYSLTLLLVQTFPYHLLHNVWHPWARSWIHGHSFSHTRYAPTNTSNMSHTHQFCHSIHPYFFHHSARSQCALHLHDHEHGSPCGRRRSLACSGPR